MRVKIGRATPPSDVHVGKRALENNSRGVIPKWEHNKLRNLSMLTPEERKRGQERAAMKNRLQHMKVTLPKIPPPKDPNVSS